MFTNGKDSMQSAIFRLKKIGPIKEAEMELGDLTIIAGRNNTGKTYLAYALYGFLKIWRELATSIPPNVDHFVKNAHGNGQGKATRGSGRAQTGATSNASKGDEDLF